MCAKGRYQTAFLIAHISAFAGKTPAALGSSELIDLSQCLTMRHLRLLQKI